MDNSNLFNIIARDLLGIKFMMVVHMDTLAFCGPKMRGLFFLGEI